MLPCIACALAALLPSAQPDPFRNLLAPPDPVRLDERGRWTVTGALESSDHADFSGGRYDAIPIVLPPGAWNIQMHAEDFDAYMSIVSEEGGIARPGWLIENDDGGWAPGDAGITARTERQRLLAISAASFQPGTLGDYEIVVRAAADDRPVLPLDRLAEIHLLRPPVDKAMLTYIDKGPFDLTEAIAAAKKILAIHEEQQGGYPGVWWEFADVRYVAAYLQTLAGLSDEDVAELQAAERAIAAGDAAIERGNEAIARASFERAVEIRERILGNGHVEVAYVLSRLARAEELLQEHDAARAHHERAVGIYERALGYNHPETSRALSDLADLHYRLAEDEQARAGWAEALAIDRAIHDPRDPALGHALTRLAAAETALGRHDRARELLQENLRIVREFWGENHPDTALAMNRLGVLLYSMGEHESAREQLAPALLIFAETLGMDHANTIDNLDSLALTEIALGDYEAAAPRLERVVRWYEQSSGRDHPETSEALRRLASCREAAGDLRAALALHERALHIRSQALGENDPLTQASRDDVARLKAEIG